MAFSIDVHDLPTIRSYEDAVRVFTDIKPIRGGSQSVKRLGKRSDKNKTLVEEIVDGIKVYRARLWYSDLVSYFPTHYEISMGGYPSRSTEKFIDKVSPSFISKAQKSDFIPKDFVLDSEISRYYYFAGVPINTGSVYKFAYGSNAPLEPLKHPTYQKFAVDRKKMNEVRRNYRPFTYYVRAMHGLTQPDTFERSGYKLYSYTQVIEMVESGDLRAWSDIFSWLYSAARSPARSWRSERPEAYCDLKDVFALFDVAVKACNPQVLKVVAVTSA